MKSPYSGILLTSTMLASAADFTVSQDGWIDFFDDAVQEEGIGNRLNVATANPSSAFGYTRLAYFGFDLAGADLAAVGSAELKVKLADDVLASYGEANVRFYLVSNALSDDFDETLLSDSNAPGLTQANVLTGQRTTGAIIGDIQLPSPPAGQELTLSFSSAAITEMANDTNGFITIVAENRIQNNAGYAVSASTGLGFDSKESGNGAVLTLNDFPLSAPLAQDGWVDFGDGNVKELGTGTRLSIATPNPSGAFQYSRMGYFGFDISTLDLASSQSAILRVKFADDIAGYLNSTVRFYLVANSLSDSFDETTLTDGNAPGLTVGNLLSAQRINGTVIGEANYTRAGGTVDIAFTPDAFADIANDENGFVTIAVESRGQNNNGYGAFTGLGFDSKESGNGAQLFFSPESVVLTHYETFVTSFNLFNARAAANFDADGDGSTNLMEFAFAGTNPIDKTDTPSFYCRTDAGSGDSYFFLFAPIFSGSEIDLDDPAGGPLALKNTVAQINYRVEGSADLTTFSLNVSDVPAVDFSSLPILPEGYEYRAFEAAVPGIDPTSFLRISTQLP